MPNRRDLARAAVVLAAGTARASERTGVAADDIHVASGEYRIDYDRTVRGTLTVSPGARLFIRRGVTLTLLGDLIAPAVCIFTGDGRVDLSRSRVVAARPEWWGAIPGDGGNDCVTGIEAALAAHPAVQLGLGDYRLGRTLVIDRPNRRLWGIGRTNGENGTRLLLAGGDDAVLRVGPAVAPASVNAYLRGIDVRGIELGRSKAPLDHATHKPVGLLVRHVLDCVFDGLRANEHAIAFSFCGAVRTLVRDCAAFRSSFAGRPDDAFVGFDLDGTDSPIDTGANASLYLIDCSARTGNRPSLAGTVGCRLLGAFSDTFLVRFETTQLGYGVVIDGHPEPARPVRSRYAHLDLHIDTPVLDQCGQAGIAIRNLTTTAMIDIASCWIAVVAGGQAGIRITDTGGAISVTAGQIVATGGGASIGVLVERATGVSLADTKMLDVVQPIVARGATGFDFAPVVLAGSGAGDVAITLANCAHGAVRARLIGPESRFATGVALDSTCRSILVETFGLAAATIPLRIGTTIPTANATGIVAIP